MRKGDLVLFYHSVSEKQVVAIAKVASQAYPDPTAREGDWSCVDLAPVKALKKPVALDVIKADKQMADMLLTRHSRLSVMPMARIHFARLLELGETRL